MTKDFVKARRRAALSRPRGKSSKHNKIWPNQQPKNPGLASAITTSVLNLAKRFTTLAERIEATTLQDFELLPNDVGSLFRVNKIIVTGYLYEDLKTKSPFDSMTTTTITDGEIILSLGKEIWPIPLPADDRTWKEPTKTIRHALWKFLYKESVWVFFASNIRDRLEANAFEKIVLEDG